MSSSTKRTSLLLLCASAVVALMASRWHFTALAPSLRATAETALIVSGLASVLFVWGPWSRSDRAADLLALAAVMTLVIEDLEGFAAPAMVGSGRPTFEAPASLASHLLVAAVFAAAALAPRGPRTPGRSRAIMLVALVALCPVAFRTSALLVPGVLSSSDAANDTNLGIILTVPAICLLFIATAGFVRTSLREPMGMNEALLGAATTSLAAVWAYHLLVPSAAVSSTVGSVCLRAACFGLILGAALNVHAQQGRAQVDAVVARERRKLAGDLHDGLAQDLALIAAYGQQLAPDLGVEHPVTLAAEHALAATRGVIVDLSASDQPTATEALRAVAGQLARQFEVRVDVTASSEHLAGEPRESVVRIAREAIVNAVTHGGAKHITVTLQTHGNQLMLRIDDDGCGLGHAVPAGQYAGHGLREMTEWAQAIGGRLTAQQGAHGGTAVKVLVS